MRPDRGWSLGQLVLGCHAGFSCPRRWGPCRACQVVGYAVGRVCCDLHSTTRALSRGRCQLPPAR
jgi:hypothetical protein